MSGCAMSNRASVGFGARDGDRPTRRDVLQGGPYCTIGASIALDRWPRLRSDVARRVGAEDWTGHFLYLGARA
jgi:hypothetical protein